MGEKGREIRKGKVGKSIIKNMKKGENVGKTKVNCDEVRERQ